MAEDMRAAGIDPAINYAFEKSGRLVTAQNKNLLSDEDLAEGDDAIDEWEEKSGAEGALTRRLEVTATLLSNCRRISLHRAAINQLATDGSTFPLKESCSDGSGDNGHRLGCNPSQLDSIGHLNQARLPQTGEAGARRRNLLLGDG